MRPRLTWLGLLLALTGCDTDPGPTPAPSGPGEMVLFVAVDGVAEVRLDDEVVATVEGTGVAHELVEPLGEGTHSLTLALSGGGAGGPAVAAWARLPDGGWIVTGEDWLDAEDRGGHGADPWRWAPAAMMGTGARWIAPAGGGEGAVSLPLVVGPEVADRWTVTPAAVEAGAPVQVTLRLVAGSAGVRTGEHRTLAHSALDNAWGHGMPYPAWSDWQTDDPGAPGWLHVVDAPDGVTIELAVDEQVSGFDSPGPFVDGGRLALDLWVREGELSQGDVVELSWGDGGAADAQAPRLARRHVFPHPGCEDEPSMDYPGAAVGRCPGVQVVGGVPASVRVAARGGVVAAGEPVVVSVAVLDEVGNLSGAPPSSLVLASTDAAAELPGAVALDGVPPGTGTMTVTLHTPGLHQISASDGAVSGTAAVFVTDDAPEARLFFGDLHAHTLASDGVAHADAAYRHADLVAGLDFAAVSDHAERVTADEWDEAQARAAWLTRPDFLVLAAYEWTGKQTMHRNVYVKQVGDPIPIVRASSFQNADDPVTEIGEVWDRLQDRGLTVPHHPGSAVTGDHQWVDFDPAREPVVEIYSKHGSSECFGCAPSIRDNYAQPPGNYARDALAAGHRFGFIASGDGHETPLGSAAPDHLAVFGDADFGPMQRRGGLAAIYAPELTHAALLDALQERRCYATTGARIAVAFAVDGAPMGSEVVGAGPATITLSVGGTAELAEVMVVRHTAAEGWTIPVVWMPGAATFEQSWVDEDTAADAIYYLHVLQTDQHHAWSSPVWVDRP